MPIRVKAKDTCDDRVHFILGAKVFCANTRLVKHNVSCTKRSKVRVGLVIKLGLGNVVFFSTPTCF